MQSIRLRLYSQERRVKVHHSLCVLGQASQFFLDSGVSEMADSSDDFGEEAKDVVVRVPALGARAAILILVFAGFLFLVVGLVIDGEFVNRPPPDIVVFWFFRAFLWICAFVGGFILIWAMVEMLRRYVFRLFGGNLHRETIIGPTRWRRAWPQAEIAGTTLRSTGLQWVGGEPIVRLKLVLNDGTFYELLPQRPAAILDPVNEKLRGLLFADATSRVFDDPPLGGGLAASESPGKLTIIARPIKPSMVSSLYHVAIFGISIDIVMSLVMVVIGLRLFKSEPLFWYFLLGQLATICIGGIWIQRWIRGIASRDYEIAIDNSRVVVFRKDGARVTREERNVSDVVDVESETVVSSGEGSDKKPEIVRLKLKTKSGPAVEVLYGRPPEETQWAETRIKRFLNEQRIPATDATAD